MVGCRSHDLGHVLARVAHYLARVAVQKAGRYFKSPRNARPTPRADGGGVPVTFPGSPFENFNSSNLKCVISYNLKNSATFEA